MTRFVISALVAASLSGPPVGELPSSERIGESGRVHGVPVLLDSIRRPGAPIADDFVVAEGSVLLGDVLPAESSISYRGYKTEDRGWSAVLLVIGDPVAVIERYQEQAEALGIPKQVEAADACRGTPEVFLDCHLGYSEGPTFFSRGIAISMHRSARPPSSAVVLSYIDTGPPPPDYVDPAITYTYGADVEVAPNVELPTDWDALPATGDRLTAWNVRPRLRLVEGSQLVGPVTSSPCTDGSLAVLRVTGNPREIVDAYATQYPGDAIDTTTKRKDDGASIIEGGAGGLDFRVQAVVRRGRPTYLWISSCYG